jgi:hypothetical protein
MIWEWTRGHRGHQLNERCDALAEAAARHCFLQQRHLPSSAGIPVQLLGTEKQRRWALRIRAGAVGMLRREISAMNGEAVAGLTDEGRRVAAALIQQALGCILRIDCAAWWIAMNTRPGKAAEVWNELLLSTFVGLDDQLIPLSDALQIVKSPGDPLVRSSLPILQRERPEPPGQASNGTPDGDGLEWLLWDETNSMVTESKCVASGA